MFSVKKIVTVITLVICLSFIILALYAYFVLKRASSQSLMITVLFFGTGAIVETITLVSKHEGWFAKRQDLSKRECILMAICGLIFSFCSLWIALVSNIHIFLKLVLFIGFLFFSIGSVILLIKTLKKTS